MPSIKQLVARDRETTMSTTSINLIIVLLVLVLVAILCAGALYIMRSYRKSRAAKSPGLPMYTEIVTTGRNSRRLTINAFVTNEKANLIENSSSPPQSPVPEIRITFPDEQDEGGRRKSGRVVIVRVGDKSVGLEPVHYDGPPSYESSDNGRFDSVDLERIGGLREKSSEQRWS